MAQGLSLDRPNIWDVNTKMPREVGTRGTRTSFGSEADMVLHKLQLQPDNPEAFLGVMWAAGDASQLLYTMTW